MDKKEQIRRALEKRLQGYPLNVSYYIAVKRHRCSGDEAQRNAVKQLRMLRSHLLVLCEVWGDAERAVDEMWPRILHFVENRVSALLPKDEGAPSPDAAETFRALGRGLSDYAHRLNVALDALESSDLEGFLETLKPLPRSAATFRTRNAKPSNIRELMRMCLEAYQVEVSLQKYLSSFDEQSYLKAFEQDEGLQPQNLARVSLKKPSK